MNHQHLYITSDDPKYGHELFHIKVAYPGLTDEQVGAIRNAMGTFGNQGDPDTFIKKFPVEVFEKHAPKCVIIEINACTPLRNK